MQCERPRSSALLQRLARPTGRKGRPKARQVARNVQASSPGMSGGISELSIIGSLVCFKEKSEAPRLSDLA